jgi:hypothetical protein
VCVLVICILYSEVFIHLTEVSLTLTVVFPCFFLSCTAYARVKTRKDGARPAVFHIICYLSCSVVVLFCVFVCKCVLPPGDNPIAVNILYYIKPNLPLLCNLTPNTHGRICTPPPPQCYQTSYPINKIITFSRRNGTSTECSHGLSLSLQRWIEGLKGEIPGDVASSTFLSLTTCNIKLYTTCTLEDWLYKS